MSQNTITTTPPRKTADSKHTIKCLFRLGLVSRDGMPDPVGIMSMSGAFSAVLYDDLRKCFSKHKTKALCGQLLYHHA